MKVELLLGAERSSWNIPAHHGTEMDRTQKMTAVRDRILKRDDYVCQACLWKSGRWQEIHHINHNHQDFNESNLATLCPLCHQFFHLATAASTGGGVLIWLPELSQKELNNMCVAIFVALKKDKHAMSGAARSLYGALESRMGFVDENIATGASDPGVLAQAMLGMKREDYARRADFLGSLRLLPYASRFQAPIDYWASSQFKDYPLEQWEKMMETKIDYARIFREIGV